MDTCMHRVDKQATGNAKGPLASLPCFLCRNNVRLHLVQVNISKLHTAKRQIDFLCKKSNKAG